MAKIEVKGQNRLLKHLKLAARPGFIFDKDIKKIARKSYLALKKTTPRDTGQTAKKWKAPRKLKEAVYLVQNVAGTQDKKHNIAMILNTGRRSIKPKKAKRLYVPLTRRAKNKKLGAPIPSGFVFGKDYVLTKFVKAVKGIKFIDNRLKEAGIGLSRLMARKITKIHGSRK